MTKEELKKKIVEVVNQWHMFQNRDMNGHTIWLTDDSEKLADALIEAGIGDVERIQSENAALRERLEKSVELKAKVGDTIYMPWKYDGTYDVASLLITGIYFKNDEFHYITNLESDSAIYLAKYEYGIFRNQDFDNIVFTDRIAAEARLAELKGEKNNE